MANEIALSSAIRSNLLNLQSTQKNMDMTQTRLSTGRKVNSALDDPNAFFAAQGLSNRGNDLSRLMDSMGQAIQTLKAADNGIESLTTLVEQAQATAQTARDESSLAARVTGDDIADADATDLTTAGSATFATADAFTLTAGTGNTVTYTAASGDSLADVAAAINASEYFEASVVEGSAAGQSAIKVKTTNGEDLAVSDDTGSPADALGIVDTTAASAPDNQAQLEADYDKLRTQIDEMVQDTGYRGTNLLKGDDLSIQFNEDNSSKLDVTGKTYDSDGLGINAADFSSKTNIETNLSELTAGLEELRSGARSFGNNLATVQNRENFTEQTVNTLQEGADKLTLADMNEESAKMLSLQTTQTLGITSLSLASQAQQGIMRLF